MSFFMKYTPSWKPDKKKDFLIIRVNPEEKARIESEAERQNMTVSELIRGRAMRKAKIMGTDEVR